MTLLKQDRLQTLMLTVRKLGHWNSKYYQDTARNKTIKALKRIDSYIAERAGTV